MPDLAASYGRIFVFIAFFCVFSYMIDEYSCLKYCIFTKPNVNMPNLTAGYERFFDSIAFLLYVNASSNFYKLCVKAEVK